MNWNDYLEQVKEDAIEYIEENAEHCEDFEEMYEDLFLSDSVTGNSSGSYTFSSAKAAEYVGGIIFDGDAIAAFEQLGYEGIPTKQGPEACDVIARCIALEYAYGELEEYFNEFCK